MNISPSKNEQEVLLLSTTKNCETLNKQTHTQPEETLEFTLTKPRKTFHSNPIICIENSWMIGLTNVEVYNSIFNITEENNKFELYNFPDSESGGTSYERVRDDIEKDLKFSDITGTDLQDEIIGRIIIDEYREQVLKRMKNDEYMRFSAIFDSSVFQVFESFLRTEIDLVEDNIRLVLDENNSSFMTYELEPGVYTVKNLFEVLAILLPRENDPSHSIDIEFDEITPKTKLVARSDIIASTFDDKSIFNSILGFNSHWDYKSIMKTTTKILYILVKEIKTT